MSGSSYLAPKTGPEGKLAPPGVYYIYELLASAEGGAEAPIVDFIERMVKDHLVCDRISVVYFLLFV